MKRKDDYVKELERIEAEIEETKNDSLLSEEIKLSRLKSFQDLIDEQKNEMRLFELSNKIPPV